MSTEDISIPEQMRKFEADLRKLENSHVEDGETPGGQAAVIPPLPRLPVPVGTQLLLDAQLGEALKIMRDYSQWVHGPQIPIHHCLNVSDALARLMLASAQLGTVAARLQAGEPESRHRVIVEHAAPASARGERVGETAKRINPPDA